MAGRSLSEVSVDRFFMVYISIKVTISMGDVGMAPREAHRDPHALDRLRNARASLTRLAPFKAWFEGVLASLGCTAWLETGSADG